MQGSGQPPQAVRGDTEDALCGVCRLLRDGCDPRRNVLCIQDPLQLKPLRAGASDSLTRKKEGGKQIFVVSLLCLFWCHMMARPASCLLCAVASVVPRVSTRPFLALVTNHYPCPPPTLVQRRRAVCIRPPVSLSSQSPLHPAVSL